MKKVAIALVILLAVSVIILAGLRPYGFALFGVPVVGDSEQAELYELGYSFLEALKYKDFDDAAGFHTWEDEQKADIPKLIERLFAVKPELLNIRDVKISSVDLDRERGRARTHFRAILEVLNSTQNDEEENKEREVEGILYWHKRPASEDDPPPSSAEGDGEVVAKPSVGGEAEKWFLKLESSLHDEGLKRGSDR